MIVVCPELMLNGGTVRFYVFGETWCDMVTRVAEKVSCTHFAQAFVPLNYFEFFQLCE